MLPDLDVLRQEQGEGLATALLVELWTPDLTKGLVLLPPFLSMTMPPKGGLDGR